MTSTFLIGEQPRQTKVCKRGFNLVEAAIVLGIIRLVIGGIWTAASSVQHNNRVTESSKLIGQLYQNARSLYAGHAATHHTINGPLLRSITPSNYDIKGTGLDTVIGPFGEQIGLTVTGLGTLSIYMDTTKEYCNVMAPRYLTAFSADMAPGTNMMSGDGSSIYSISDTEGACETVGGISMELKFP